MPQTKGKIKVPISGTIDRKLNITGSGEQHYYAHRRAAIKDSGFTRESFHDALRQASRKVSDSQSKDSDNTE